MKILFIGGTGIISTACTQLALQRGFDLTLLNRGKTRPVEGTHQIVADAFDRNALMAALGAGAWDVVVDFLSFTTDQLQARLDALRGRVGQYIFISSASAYQKPGSHYVITESTPLANPFWEYSRNKIACEDLLTRLYREQAFPMTIVRPSFTYGETVIPVAINSWSCSYTAVDRMRRGLPVIVPGDGLSLWTNTHNTDFAKALVGLLGNCAAIGHSFHITSDEVLTWDQIYRQTAAAAGVDNPKLVHIASDFIVAQAPGYEGPLLGDKSNPAIFDNSKIKRFVPGFVATTPFRRGVEQTVAWYDADASRRRIDHEANAEWDRIIAAYQRP